MGLTSTANKVLLGKASHMTVIANESDFDLVTKAIFLLLSSKEQSPPPTKKLKAKEIGRLLYMKQMWYKKHPPVVDAVQDPFTLWEPEPEGYETGWD